MQGLPQFRRVTEDYATQFAERVFGEAFNGLHSQPGHYYRALFNESYFTIQPGNDKPSKSQWNTLKKRMKRMNPSVFILREYGDITHEGEAMVYIDFGFLEG